MLDDMLENHSRILLCRQYELFIDLIFFRLPTILKLGSWGLMLINDC